MGLTCLVLGAVSLLLAMAVDGLRIFSAGESGLRAALESGGFVFTRELGLRGVSGVILAVVACFGMVAMVLGSPGTMRRVMLGLSLLILVAMLLLVFAAWGIFWQPLSLLLGVLWAWLSALLYAARHHMPCEGVQPTARISNVIQMKSKLPEKSEPRKKNGDGSR